MDPSTFSGSVWGIIYYNLEGQVPSQTVFGSIGIYIYIYIYIYVYNYIYPLAICYIAMV